jgi:hypothetical protein
VGRQVQPGGHRGDPGAGERRENDRQRDRAEHDLGGEQRASQGDVVHRREAGAAAAGHQQPPLAGSQPGPLGEHAGGGAAQQLRGVLPADGRTEADDDLGDYRSQERAAEGQPLAGPPDHVVDVGFLARHVPAQQVPGHPAEYPGRQQRDEPPEVVRPLYRGLERPAVVAEGGVLHAEQQQHHQVGEQPGRDPRDRHQHPEPQGERGVAVTGRVRLLGGAAARRHSPLDQWRRHTHPSDPNVHRHQIYTCRSATPRSPGYHGDSEGE